MAIGTGAPADRINRNAPIAREPCGGAVRTTLAKAAGEANTMVASIAEHAASNAPALKVAGLVTSTAGIVNGIPSVGP